MLLPTRGRPLLARRLLASVLSQSQDASRVEVILYVDDDDLDSHAIKHEQLRITTIVGPRVSMGECNSACLGKARGQIIMLANDDMVIRTRAWDERLATIHSTYPDGIYLAYGNDTLKKSRVCTFPILSRRTCEIIGDPFPKAFRGAFIDYHLLDIFRRLEKHGLRRVVYLPDVVFEHLHYRTGKAMYDRTYMERDRFGDDNTFLSLRTERSIAAARLVRSVTGADAPEPDGRRNSAEQDSGSSSWAAAKFVVFDDELPLPWRVRLFSWFVLRLAARQLILLAPKAI